MEQLVVINKIDCMNCQANYVVKTEKKLGTRRHEHRCLINRHDEKTPMVENNHRFARSNAR